mmetsp:Transcript_106470/g.286317  ORF Transcript_106470/g.286317 Transcript_106470/m.286317 type:complete len:320 (-) Transcript_106470:189-1148(-)
MSELGPGAASFFDPHFHIWDVSESTQSGHDGKILFKPGGKECYLRSDYEAEFAGLPSPLRHRGGVFVEGVSVCHPGLSGPEFSLRCLEEAKFARYCLSTAAGEAVSYLLVPTCALEQPDAAEVLRELARSPATRGVRQILNFEPNWPRNGALGDLLDSPQWREGFGLLKTVGFSFDMQLNPPQYQKAVALLKEHLDTTVIINHLGCPTMADLTEKKDQYWSGMEALAALPNTYIKLSMLCYADPNWDESEVVVSAVHRVISTFGASRCMFASNYPVDVKDGWPAARLFSAFLKLAERYSDEERAHLFIGAAQRAYRWVQ